MDLLLWRHAEAEDPVPGQNDLERRLTDKGQTQAEAMGRWLRRRVPPDAVVLVSPARRCQETAQGLGRSFQTVAALAPDQGWEALLDAVQWPNGHRAALVIGHQPTLGETAAHLMCGMDLPWSIRKGAVCWFRYRVREATEDVVLRALVAPDVIGD
jgi:phosphohistidine phosphatase